MPIRSLGIDTTCTASVRCGVARIVLIQMSFYGYDNSYMLDTMARFPGVFSGVAVIDPAAADVRDQMLQLKSRGVRGLRLNPRSLEPAKYFSQRTSRL